MSLRNKLATSIIIGIALFAILIGLIVIFGTLDSVLMRDFSSPSPSASQAETVEFQAQWFSLAEEIGGNG